MNHDKPASSTPRRSIIDVGLDELSVIASEAWNNAAASALAKGHAITGSRNGRIIRQHPDGRTEDLGPVAPLAAPTP